MLEAKFTDDTLARGIKHWASKHTGTGIGYGHVLGQLAVHMKEMGWNKSYKEVARIAVELGKKKKVESVNETIELIKKDNPKYKARLHQVKLAFKLAKVKLTSIKPIKARKGVVPKGHYDKSGDRLAPAWAITATDGKNTKSGEVIFQDGNDPGFYIDKDYMGLNPNNKKKIPRNIQRWMIGKKAHHSKGVDESVNEAKKLSQMNNKELIKHWVKKSKELEVMKSRKEIDKFAYRVESGKIARILNHLWGLQKDMKEEGFGGELKGSDKQKFEKARKENAEVLGYELTGTKDIKESSSAYGKSIEKIANNKKLKSISKKDRDTLMKIAKQMKKSNESINEGNKSKKVTKRVLGSLRELIFGIQSVRKMIDDAPYNKLYAMVSGELYKFEVDLFKKLRSFQSPLKKLAQDKMVESWSMGLERYKVTLENGEDIDVKVKEGKGLEGLEELLEKEGLKFDKITKKASRPTLSSESVNEDNFRSRAIDDIDEIHTSVKYLASKIAKEDRKHGTKATREYIKFYKQHFMKFYTGVTKSAFNLLADGVIKEKMDREQFQDYIQYVLKTQFKTPEEKKMKKSIIKKLNIANKKKGLPLFKERTQSIGGEELMKYLMKRFKMSKSKAIATMKKHKMDLSFLKKESVNEVVEPQGNMAKIQKIVKDKQATKLGGVMIDMQSANLLMKLWDAVSDKDKEKMNKLNPKVLTTVIKKLWSRVKLKLPI